MKEEDKKRLEEQISKLLNDFNEKHNVEIGAVDVEYWRYGSTAGDEKYKYASVKLRLRY